jgi:hypothetical protein
MSGIGRVRVLHTVEVLYCNSRVTKNVMMIEKMEHGVEHLHLQSTETSADVLQITPPPGLTQI